MSSYIIRVTDGNNAQGLLVSSTQGTPIPPIPEWRLTLEEDAADSFTSKAALDLVEQLKKMGFTTQLQEVRKRRSTARSRAECPQCQKPLEATLDDEDGLRAYQCNTDGCGYYEQFE